MKINFCAAFLFLLMGASCGTTRSMYQLLGEWNVIQLNGESITPRDDTPFLGFDMDKQQVYGFTGCNRLTGTFDPQKLANGKVDFSKMGCTRMLCQDDRYERPFLEALAQAHRSKLLGDTLSLFNAQGKEIITLKKR